MTTISDNKVAFIHYTLTNPEGAELDTSRGGDPMPYLHGTGSIVPGLEEALADKKAGDKVQAIVPPEEAYGPKSGQSPVPVPRKDFEGVEPQPGMPLVVETESGEEIQVFVASVQDDTVLLTQDHPLAGLTLHFDVEVMEVRDATAEELEHGHAHSGDGHHH